MAGLSCGEASPVAWTILQQGAQFFMTIPDDAAIDAMRLLARSESADYPIVAGESATAGLAALLLVADPKNRERIGLDQESVVLLLGTEGATDPALYASLVGLPPSVAL